MNIEIAEPGRMTQSGSSLLKLIQNNNMPILDLLVRESIQNSLDAYRENVEYVNIEFLTGEFRSIQFSKHLEGIEQALNNKIKSDRSRYIAIKDSNTKGLTGKLHYDEVQGNQYGNLLKLVYEISKPQDSPGAGGSWGLGKTVYFRIGIGMVLYYSRILNEDNKYESRLAVSMVEDEHSVDSIIPHPANAVKRGIAWWGEKIDKNKTKPITDEREIEEILSIFGIQPYVQEETGTTILIPYIDDKELLTHNMVYHLNDKDEEYMPFWYSSIEEYIRISVQRWYTPRLNNRHYQYGKWLRVLVNGKGIALDDMEPVFNVIQALYNRASVKGFKGEDVLSNANVFTKNITTRNILKSSEAGCVAYIKVNKSLLGMIPPFNKANPYIYINEENLGGDKNKPILLFTRKPGMVVSYETTGPWTDSIPSSDKDEFIIGIFVLNSLNTVVCMGEEFSLEEYVRKSEMADHTSWNDWSKGQLNPRIVSKVQGHVRNAIIKSYKEEEPIAENRLNSGLGKMFGDLLLPPENFGKKPSMGGSKPSEAKIVTKHKNATLKINKAKIKYTAEGMLIPFEVKCTKAVTELIVDIYIGMENGKLSVNEWEEGLGQELPFSLTEVVIGNLIVDKKQYEDTIIIDRVENEIEIGEIKISLVYSSNNIAYGIRLYSVDKLPYQFSGTMMIKVIEKNIRTVLNLYTNEGVK